MPRRWAVIPAAGTGRRMGVGRPKQYLDLCGRTVIEHTLSRICGPPGVDGVVVAVREGDPWWPRLATAADRRIARVAGGEERHLSVLRGLEALAERGSARDWVLVHDAVRPCVRAGDLERLVAAAAGEESEGAVLGVPARDAMKRVDAGGSVVETLGREGLWHAQTPQMFRLGALLGALRGVARRGAGVGDESQAMEEQGVRPAMVEGHSDNIKITRPEDLALAQLYLAAQEGD